MKSSLLSTSQIALFLSKLFMDPVDGISTEEYSYLSVHPRVFPGIEGFSCGKVLTLELEESVNLVSVALVKSGILDVFDEYVTAILSRSYILRNEVSQAKALGGARSLICTLVV